MITFAPRKFKYVVFCFVVKGTPDLGALFCFYTPLLSILKQFIFK